MQENFQEAVLGRTGMAVKRMGLSTSYFPGKKAVHYALDHGVNFFFGYGWDVQMMRVLRDLPPTERQKLVIATGGYNWILFHSNVRKDLEKRLRQLRTDYLDVFLFLGVMKASQYTDEITAEMLRFKEEGKVRAIGISGHDRKLHGQLAARGDHDVLMVRYNAAHRGAEADIFPHLGTHHTGIINYTATSWTKLFRRPKKYPKDARIPTPAECYRFVLSNEHVDVCLTAPWNLKQLKSNLEAVNEGPLSPEDMVFMCQFGDRVHFGGKR